MGSQAFHPVTHISFGLRLDYIPVSRLMVNAPVSSGDSTPFGNTGAPVPTGAFLLIAAVVLLLAPLEVLFAILVNSWIIVLSEVAITVSVCV